MPCNHVNNMMNSLVYDFSGFYYSVCYDHLDDEQYYSNVESGISCVTFWCTTTFKINTFGVFMVLRGHYWHVSHQWLDASKNYIVQINIEKSLNLFKTLK